MLGFLIVLGADILYTILLFKYGKKNYKKIIPISFSIFLLSNELYSDKNDKKYKNKKKKKYLIDIGKYK
jgi:hypothetical protein